jgi:Tfp pilus assembly protein PilF
MDALKISIWSADSAAARIALAEAYLKQQNTAAARAELERALALDPESAEAKKLLSSISK